VLPWDLIRLFEGLPLQSLLPVPSALMNVPSSALIAFGKAIVSLRQQAVNAIQPPPALGPRPANLPGSASGGASGVVPVATPSNTLSGSTLNLFNAGILSLNVFEANVAATPVGVLNLERLVMTPAGIQRGELLATIPLAPLEQTAVVQKEWSVTSQEFTSIVTDSLETIVRWA
jgi:hypothetical protein